MKIIKSLELFEHPNKTSVRIAHPKSLELFEHPNKTSVRTAHPDNAPKPITLMESDLPETALFDIEEIQAFTIVDHHGHTHQIGISRQVTEDLGFDLEDFLYNQESRVRREQERIREAKQGFQKQLQEEEETRKRLIDQRDRAIQNWERVRESIASASFLDRLRYLFTGQLDN